MVDAELSLQKQKSLVPTACTQTESSVIAVPLSKAWAAFRSLKLAQIAPKFIASSDYVSGGEGQVGSVVRVEYANGGTWELRITEFSEKHHTVAWEVVSTEPALSVTSIEGEFRFFAVTDSDQTFVQWTTEFSNDADYSVIADQKYKKQDFFAAVKENLAA